MINLSTADMVQVSVFLYCSKIICCFLTAVSKMSKDLSAMTRDLNLQSEFTRKYPNKNMPLQKK